MSTPYAEIVQFSLSPGTDGARYITASESSRNWYRTQPGYLNSEIIEGPDGQWLGIIRWETAAAAEQAAMRAGEELDMSEFMPMIDPESVRMLSGPIAARDG